MGNKLWKKLLAIFTTLRDVEMLFANPCHGHNILLQNILRDPGIQINLFQKSNIYFYIFIW